MFKFLYNFLFIESATGKVSHSKFFSVVGYVVLIWAFIYALMYGSLISYEFWTLFAVVVIGNKTLKKHLELKSRKKDDE